MATIFWSELSRQDYWENIDYLLEEWSAKEASRFIALVDKNINVIKQNPRIFAKTRYKNIRAVVITPQITLYYRVINRNIIELIRFWNNYQNPENINLGIL